MDEFEIELKNDFLQEAFELLENTEQSFLALEKSPNDQVLIDTIFRFAHNLKGTSRAVGFGDIAELTHVTENLLLVIKNGKISINESIVSVLLEFNDKVRDMIFGLRENLDARFENHDLISKIEVISSGGEVPQAASVAEEENTYEGLSDAQIMEQFENSFAPLADAFEEEEEEEVQDKVVSIIPVSVKPVVTPEKVAAPVAPIVSKKEHKKDEETIRVSVNRLDKMNDLVGELVILKSIVEASLVKSGDHKTARSLSKLCKDIQDMTMSMRMVPVGPTFQKLSRVVRDTSKLLNKKVELKLIGEEVEIDKTVLENLSDPLVHIIRNAIDHGVETPEERLLAGKSEEGTVEVMAFHEGNYLVIQITDDGKGIDPKRLITKAKASRIIPANANLSDQQGIELIFNAGFSTKEVVSEVSGRGVGMDVVKTNIEAIGGEVKIRSKVGQGSCFRLMLPLTLAIIDGMLIESGGQVLIIPRSQVHEVNRIDKSKLSMITGRSPYIQLRDQVVPLFTLDTDLGAITKSESNIALIVSQGRQVFAVGVKDVIRQLQVVVKPPTKEVAGRDGIMGTTILGDGRPALIIDLLNLYQKKIKEEKTKELAA
jgi:two-component system chemotaxis sensor kinase CheA